MNRDNTRNTDESNGCEVTCDSCTSDCNPLLDGIELMDKTTLDNNRVVIRFKKGDIIFKQGTYPSGLYCLNKGNVMISKADSNGNSIVTNLYKEVTFLGISDYLTDLPYQSTARALSDVTVCMIKRDVVGKLISENGRFVQNLLMTFARDYHLANARLLAITKKNMNSRLADTLLELYKIFGTDENECINVYLKRSEIASICNMSESNVIKHLSELSKSGMIGLEGKQISILNYEDLVGESNSNY